MIDLLVFEIFADEQTCTSRVIKGKEGKPDREVYDQNAYVKKGRQLIQVTITHDSLLEAYPAGVYTLSQDSFEVENRYGRGQLKLAFKTKLVPLADVKSTIKAA